MEIKRIVCMQCGRVIRDFGLEAGMESHGLCTECSAEFARQIDALAPARAPAYEGPPLPAFATAR